MRRIPTKAVVAAVAGLLGLWLVLAFGAVPRLIVAIHAGTGIGWLDGLLAGRDTVPLERYQAYWRSLAVRATIAGVALVVLVGLGWRFRVVLGRWDRRFLRSEPTIGPAAILLTMAWIGAAMGIVEAAYVVSRVAFAGEPQWPVFQYSRDVIWMAPLAGATCLAALGLPLVVLTRRSLGLDLRIVVFVGGSIAVYSLIRMLRAGLEPWAVALLASGIMVQAARVAASKAVRFRRFRRRTTMVVVPFLLLAAVGLHARRGIAAWFQLRNEPAPRPGAPNVLFLILDTVRAQNLELYGYERETAPRITTFAARGVVFEHAMSPSPWTLPGHVSLFTGLPPTRTSAGWYGRLDRQPPVLAERFRDAGYRTGAFIANYYYASALTGLDRGFARYEDHPIEPEMVIRNSHLLRRFVGRWQTAHGDYHFLARKSADDINAAFLSWLGAGTGPRPFFAVLNYFDAHDPYESPPAFRTRFWPEPPRYWLNTNRPFTDHELAELTAAYDASIAYLDDRVGQLLDRLETAGLLENTIVVIAADHGEQFGEHHARLNQHANSLYLQSLEVPLVIVFPGSIPPGSRVQGVTRILDVPKTLLELAGLPVTGFGGLSLTATWTAGAATPGGRAAIAQLRAKKTRLPNWEPLSKGPMRAVRYGDRFLIRNGDGSELLYDLESDPFAIDDVSAIDSIGKARMEVLLDSLTAAYGDDGR